jgi:hypothetical protein
MKFGVAVSNEEPIVGDSIPPKRFDDRGDRIDENRIGESGRRVESCEEPLGTRHELDGRSI